jgi:hypothetical protein
MAGPKIDDETETETDEHGDPIYCADSDCRHMVARGLIVCQCCVDLDAERCARTMLVRGKQIAYEIAKEHFRFSRANRLDEFRVLLGLPCPC